MHCFNFISIFCILHVCEMRVRDRSLIKVRTNISAVKAILFKLLQLSTEMSDVVSGQCSRRGCVN